MSDPIIIFENKMTPRELSDYLEQERPGLIGIMPSDCFEKKIVLSCKVNEISLREVKALYVDDHQQTTFDAIFINDDLLVPNYYVWKYDIEPDGKPQIIIACSELITQHKIEGYESSTENLRTLILFNEN